MKRQLSSDFNNIYDWFRKQNKWSFWRVSRGNVKQTEQNKQHKRVTYLGNNLDKRLCGEFIPFQAISKVTPA